MNHVLAQELSRSYARERQAEAAAAGRAARLRAARRWQQRAQVANRRAHGPSSVREAP